MEHRTWKTTSFSVSCGFHTRRRLRKGGDFINSFMAWVGGKKALRDEILARFPLNYKRYIEVFGGAGWVLFHKSPGSDFEVFNDFTRFLEELNHKRPKTMNEVEQMWYNGYGGRYIHYDDSRYHGLNLHSVFSKGTIEFRMFNSTLHAGEVKSYIQLCLAISHQALVQRGASRIKTQPENEKYTFRTWLLRLGLIGDEFKTARQHLLKNLEGNIAWRDPAQAEAQKARLAAKRQAELEMEEQQTAEEPTTEPDEQEQDAPAFSMQM